MKKFDVISVQNVPLRVGLKLDEFDEAVETESLSFRELVGGLIVWLAISTRPYISNTVRSVARDCSTPKAIHCKAALGILAYINGVCVCVFFPFILDIKFVGRTSRGHTGGRSQRVFHPLSFCGAYLNFFREKDSAIPSPRRP